MKSSLQYHFLIFILLMLFNLSAIAQMEADSADIPYRSSCQSEWVEYSNPTEMYSIVRSNRYYRVIYILEKETVYGTNRHTFMIKQNGSSSETSFSTFFYNPCGPDCMSSSVVISDMRLYDDTCYFCGKVIEPNFEIYGSAPIRKTFGFIGWFRIGDMLNGSSTISFHKVDTTTQLTRLAISKPNASSLLISAIGFQRPDRFPCIVEVEKTNNNWAWRYEYVKNAPNMIFSDIMTMRDSITLLAQYGCTNDNLPGPPDYDNNHQVFLLDRYDLRGCYNMNSPNTTTMARYYLNPSDNYFFHYDRAPMRLFHINDRLNEFGVAFGVETSNVTCGGIRLFLFSNAWQYYSSLYYQTNCHPEIKEVGNLYNTDNLYILSKDNIHNNGLTAFLSPSSTLPNVTLMSDSNYTYNSLT